MRGLGEDISVLLSEGEACFAVIYVLIVLACKWLVSVVNSNCDASSLSLQTTPLVRDQVVRAKQGFVGEQSGVREGACLSLIWIALVATLWRLWCGPGCSILM